MVEIMLKIGICADNKEASRIKQWISEEWGCDEMPVCNIYKDASQMLSMIYDKVENPDIILCNSGFGFETINKIRELNINIDIVMLLSDNCELEEGKLYCAYGYLKYPLNEQKTKMLLGEYLKSRLAKQRIYTVTVNREPYDIKLDDVVYFESRKRVIIAHCDKQEIHFYKKIGELENELSDQGFVRCHRSFIVNAKYVEEVHREYLIIKGEVISVGREYYEQSDGGIWKSLRKWDRYGAIIGRGGKYDGVIFRIKPDADIVFGSDARYADIVINEPVVDGKQAAIVFRQSDKSYSLRNNSDREIIINGNQRIKKGEIAILKNGATFVVDNSLQYFELG